MYCVDSDRKRTTIHGNSKVTCWSNKEHGLDRRHHQNPLLRTRGIESGYGSAPLDCKNAYLTAGRNIHRAAAEITTLPTASSNSQVQVFLDLAALCRVFQLYIIQLSSQKAPPQLHQILFLGGNQGLLVPFQTTAREVTRGFSPIASPTQHPGPTVHDPCTTAAHGRLNPSCPRVQTHLPFHR